MGIMSENREVKSQVTAQEERSDKRGKGAGRKLWQVRAGGEGDSRKLEAMMAEKRWGKTMKNDDEREERKEEESKNKLDKGGK